MKALTNKTSLFIQTCFVLPIENRFSLSYNVIEICHFTYNLAKLYVGGLVLKRLKLAVFVLLLCVCTVLSGALIFNVGPIPSSANAKGHPTIIIDAGHGGLTNTTD